MRLRYLSILLPCVLCQCGTDRPLTDTPPVQKMPGKPLAAGQVLRVPMSNEDHEYLDELLEPLAEEDDRIFFYDDDNNDELIGTVDPAHFQVLAASPYKVYTGELKSKFHEYEFASDEGYSISVFMTDKPEHGVRVGGINISSPTFHHFMQTLVRKHYAAKNADTKNAAHKP